MPKSRRWLKRLLWTLGALSSLALLCVGGALLYFNDEYFRQRALAELKSALGRDCEIGSAQFSLLSGSASLQNVRVLSANSSFQEKESLRIESISVKVDLWPLLRSSGRNISALKVEIIKPEVIAERDGVVWSIDDVIAKLSAGPRSSWPKKTGLLGLNADVSIRDGKVRIVDHDPTFGESAIEEIAFTARIAKLGEPLETAFSGASRTLAGRSGKLSAKAALRCIDEAGTIDPSTFKNISVSGNFDQFDVAHLARYLHIEGNLAGGQYRWTLGKPLSGTATFEAPQLGLTRISLNLETESLLNLWQERKIVAGSVPAKLTLDMEADFTGGHLKSGPLRSALLLAPTRAALSDTTAAKFADLQINTRSPSETQESITVVLKAKMDELFATDMGAILNLKNQIGGVLDGQIEFLFEKTNRVVSFDQCRRITGNLATRNGFVMIEGARQPTTLSMTFDSNITPNAAGRPDRASVSLTAAGNSFKFATQQPAQINSLQDVTKLLADARADIELRGREFAREFGPLLKVAGVAIPEDEEAKGSIRVSGTAGKLSVEVDLDVKNVTQKFVPIHLKASANFDGSRYNDSITNPFLTIDCNLTTQDKRLDLRLPVTIAQDNAQRVTVVKEFRANSELELLTELNQRFGAFVQVFLGPKYQIKGGLAQTGHSKLIQNFGANGQIASQQLALTTSINLKDFSIHGVSLVDNGPPLDWDESSAAVDLSFVFNDSLTSSSLSLQTLKLKSESLALDAEMGEANLKKIRGAALGAKASAQQWLDALPDLRLDATLSRKTLARMKSLGLLRIDDVNRETPVATSDPLFPSDIHLKAKYTAQNGLCQIEDLSATGSPELVLKTSAAEMSLKGLAPFFDNAAATPPLRWLTAIPSFPIQVSASGQFLDHIFKRLGQTGVITEISCTGNYDAAARSLKVEPLKFAGNDADGEISASGLNVERIAALLENAQGNTNFTALIAELKVRVDIRDGAFELMKKREWTPASLDLRGGGKFVATFNSATGQLQIENAEYKRSVQSDLPLKNFAFSGIIPRVNAVINNGKFDIAGALMQPGSTLNIRNFAMEPVALCRELKRLKIDAPLLDDVISGVWQPNGPWLIHNAAVKMTVQETAEISITAQTPIAWRPPNSLAPAASISGPWSFGDLRVVLAQNHKTAQGTLVLDAATVLTDAAGKLLPYNKPAETPCSLAFDLALDAIGAIQAKRVNLIGGPQSLALADFKFSSTPKMLASFSKLEFRDGPIRGALTDVLFDEQADRLRATANIPSVSLSEFAEQVKESKARLSGTLQDVVISYDGKFSALRSGFDPNQKFSLQCKASDCAISAESGGRTATLQVNGALDVNSGRTENKDIAFVLSSTENGRKLSDHQLALSLNAAPRTAGTPLLTAVQAAGLPLAAAASLTAKTPLDADQLVDDLMLIVSAFGSSQSSGGGDLSAINQLKLDATITAPALKFGATELRNFQLASLSLDNLKLAIKDAKCAAFGGDLWVKTGEFDLSRAPYSHKETLEIKNIDLNKLTSGGKPPEKDEYQVFGTLTASGSIEGIGFDEPGRLTWNSKMHLRVDNLSALKEESVGSKAKKIGAGLGAALLGQVDKRLDPLGRALDIFSDDFGVFLNKLEFEPLDLDIELQKGIARFPRTTLLGRAKNSDLQIAFTGGIDIGREQYSPNLSLWIIKMPQKTQEHLRLTQIESKDRDPILKTFSDGKFQPVELTGKLDSASANKLAIVSAFAELDNRVTRLIEEKQQRDRAATNPSPQPPAIAPAPQPKQPQPPPNQTQPAPKQTTQPPPKQTPPPPPKKESPPAKPPPQQPTPPPPKAPDNTPTKRERAQIADFDVWIFDDEEPPKKPKQGK